MRPLTGSSTQPGGLGPAGVPDAARNHRYQVEGVARQESITKSGYGKYCRLVHQTVLSFIQQTAAYSRSSRVCLPASLTSDSSTDLSTDL